jgi:hypothetical protein
MNNNTILALVFLMAGTLLTTTAVTIVPAAYAEGDDNDDYNGDGNKNREGDDRDDYNGDGNKQKAEEESAAAIADCDDNDVDTSDFDCFGIAVNDVEVDLGRLLTTLEE